MEYIEREKAKKAACEGCNAEFGEDACEPCDCSLMGAIDEIPAADVLPRDEAIKMGAELAAMHGSDATSQQLEEAYLNGVEYGMTRRDARPVVTCGECEYWEDDWTPRRARDGCHYCPVLDQCKPADWFCAEGKKREGE